MIRPETDMKMQTPVSDRVETKGLVYFARVFDKIRLKARGEMPPDYFVGVDDDPTMFDARCTRFLGIDYNELVDQTLKGGSDEEILECVSSAGGNRVRRKLRFGMRFC